MIHSDTTKSRAAALRKQGYSLKFIAHHMNIPLSTLSGWLKNIALDAQQREELATRQQAGLQAARAKAADWHRAQKSLRQHTAQQEAQATLSALSPSPEILDLTLALLCFGEGKKGEHSTTISNSNVLLLQFALTVLRRNYHLTNDHISCELHLRADQDAAHLKEHWSQELGIPLDRFTLVTKDQRTAGRPTYDTYKGVCVIRCGQVAIQRKLTYLYTLFCEKIVAELGAISSVG